MARIRLEKLIRVENKTPIGLLADTAIEAGKGIFSATTEILGLKPKAERIERAIKSQIRRKRQRYGIEEGEV